MPFSRSEAGEASGAPPERECVAVHLIAFSRRQLPSNTVKTVKKRQKRHNQKVNSTTAARRCKTPKDLGSPSVAHTLVLSLGRGPSLRTVVPPHSGLVNSGEASLKAPWRTEARRTATAETVP